MKASLSDQLKMAKNKIVLTPEGEYSNFDLFGGITDLAKTASSSLLGGSSGVTTGNCGAMPVRGLIDLTGSYQKQYDAWKACADTANAGAAAQNETDLAIANALNKPTTSTGMPVWGWVAISAVGIGVIATIIIVVKKSRKKA